MSPNTSTGSPFLQPETDGLPPSLPFPVVGIGASAGGIEATSQLLKSLTPNPGLSFLVVLHLQPDHASCLAEILAKTTPLKVSEATSGTRVQVDHAYIIPPNCVMTIHDGSIVLERRPMRGPHMPIDHLFRSLAETQYRRAIGVILSGGGTDGTLGFQAIKAAGGITFAQDDKSAEHDSMPRSAIADGSVDYVLPPPEIAQELVRLAHHPYATDQKPDGLPAGEVGAEPPEVIPQILALLRAGMAVDFTRYKQTTILRRIQRRVALRGLTRLDEYLELLRSDPAEQGNLYQDFLIRVTQFFRDPEAFEALKDKVLPPLLHNHPRGSPLRLWVCGCSTGEEAYSLAIVLLEFLAGRPDAPPIKILATDLNEATLERARAGLYIDNIEIDVSPERLRRFFIRSDGHYQVNKTVRETCIFSRHNLASDPPYSHLDLVSCRNVLIYLDAGLQRRLLPIFHYALNPGGFLFLGSSESIGPFGDLFIPVDARNRIFSKKATSATRPLDFPPYLVPEGTVRYSDREPGLPAWSGLDVQREADRIVLARYAPAGVVVDELMRVVQFRGRTGAYLEPAPGMASLDLLRMLREGLLAEVRGGITQAREENAAVSREGIRLGNGDHGRLVQVEVIPFKVPPAGIRFFLVLFHDQVPAEGRTVPAQPEPRPSERPPVAADKQVASLQQELGALREYLQAVIEEHESTNEELKSANEEILSANEELHSTNEELQTAKEEAQSANEELVTVNEELNRRNAELARVNDDLVNLLSGVNIPIVMVSRDLRIRRFTPLAEKVFNLIPTDVGRPLGDVKSSLRVEDLSRMIADVITALVPYESQVQDNEGHWYVLRIRPYVTLENKIDGASIVLLDIDSIKRGPEPSQAP